MTTHPTGTDPTPLASFCPDCYIGIGQAHHEGCGVARCLATGLQRLGHDKSCRCPQDVWTGRWPGEAECLEFGWTLGPGLPDLNRLLATATWDSVAHRWILPGNQGHDHRKRAAMTMLTTATDSSACTDLAADEYWIEFVPAAHTESHQASFPAFVEPPRHHGLWVRPRLRREVAQAVCEWLNVVYPVDPDWYPLARFEDDVLVVFTGEAAHQRHEIAIGEDGRYALGELGRWFLSAPPRTRAGFYRQLDVLRDAERHYPRPGETVVTCDPDNLPVSGFPARIETRPAAPWVPVFRPEIAEAVAVWCATNHDTFPDKHPLVYFDGDTLVHVHQHLRAVNGYLPCRIDPDADGNYRIDGDEWTFQAVSEKSEG